MHSWSSILWDFDGHKKGLELLNISCDVAFRKAKFHYTKKVLHTLQQKNAVNLLPKQASFNLRGLQPVLLLTQISWVFSQLGTHQGLGLKPSDQCPPHPLFYFQTMRWPSHKSEHTMIRLWVCKQIEKFYEKSKNPQCSHFYSTGRVLQLSESFTSDQNILYEHFRWHVIHSVLQCSADSETSPEPQYTNDYNDGS